MKIGDLVKYVDVDGKQEAYHKSRGLGIIIDWNSERGRWLVQWPNATVTGGWKTFEWTTHIRTIA